MKNILFLLLIPFLLIGESDFINEYYNARRIMIEPLDEPAYIPGLYNKKFFYTSEFDFPELNMNRVTKTMDLWATYYNLAQADEVSSGTALRDIDGNSLGVHLTHRAWCNAALQGTVHIMMLDGSRKTYGHAGKTTVSYVDCSSYYSDSIAEKIGKNKFILKDSLFGSGARGSVVPFRSIAVDQTGDPIPYHSVVYIPDARGVTVTLPDGSSQVHDGYFYAIDTGSAIHNDHIDVYHGFANSTPFSFIKGSSSSTFKAYIVDDPWIKDVLGDAHSVPYNTGTGTLSFLTPRDGDKVDKSLEFKVETTGDVVKVVYVANDASWVIGESTDKNNNFKFPYVFNGTDKLRTISARGYDSEGRILVGAYESIQFTPTDAGSGTVRFTEPLDGKDVANPVVFRAAVTGDVTQVAYYAESILLETVTSGSDFRFERLFDTPGTRTLNVYGMNSDGVVLAQDSVTVTVNAATIGFVTPTQNETVDNPVIFNLNVPQGVERVVYEENGETLHTATAQPFQWQKEFAEGKSHTVTVRGYVSDILIATASVSFDVMETSTEHSLTFTQPLNNALDLENPVNIALTASEQIKKVEIHDNGLLSKTLTAKPFNTTLNLTSGSHILVAKGFNAAGEYIKGAYVSVTIKQIGTGSLVFLAPQSQQWITGDVRVELTASEGISYIELYENGKPIKVISQKPFNTVIILPAGGHEITAKGFDASEKQIAEVTVLFVVEDEDSSLACDFGGTTNQWLLLLLPLMLLVARRCRKLFQK